MRNRISGWLVALAAGLLVAAPGAALAQPATVTVVHGIPGADLGLEEALPVDVFVAGVGCALTDFRFGDVSPRLALPAGGYDVQVRLSDGACGGPIAIDAPGVAFESGENATVIAHLSEAGAPTASKFTNDVSLSAVKFGRFGLHHTAAVAAVDIRLIPWWTFVRGQDPIEIPAVTNGAQAEIEAAAGLYVALISPAGARKVVGLDFLWLPAEQNLQLYAVGSLEAQSFQLLDDRQDQVEPSVPGTPATVTVLHGIPGADLGLDPSLPVDVFVAGVGCALSDFRFADISPRLALPAGSYDIEVRLSDGACTGPLAIDATGVPIAAGENATIVAHLDAAGAPTASKFTHELGDPGGYRGRVVLHHTANAPAVDIAGSWLFGRWKVRLFELLGVENGDSANEVVFAGRLQVEIAPAGGSPIFAATTRVEADEAVLVYAVGSLANGTFQLLEDRQPLRH